MELYQMQIDNGMYFLHEHPATATSWREKSVQKIASQEGVTRITSDMCAFGMYQEENGTNHLVKKPTTFMTNSPQIAKRLDKRCDKGHSHTVLVGGRAKRAEVYPDQLCREIVYGLTDQMIADGRVGSSRGKLIMYKGRGDAKTKSMREKNR